MAKVIVVSGPKNIPPAIQSGMHESQYVSIADSTRVAFSNFLHKLLEVGQQTETVSAAPKKTRRCGPGRGGAGLVLRPTRAAAGAAQRACAGARGVR